MAQPLYYRLYTGDAPITEKDEWGNLLETSEQLVSYAAPVAFRASISPASGISAVEQFGDLENYDKVVVTGDMTCPIDEQSVLYIDEPPVKTGSVWSAPDYVVRRVAKSTNYISIAVRKVSMSCATST